MTKSTSALVRNTLLLGLLTALLYLLLWLLEASILEWSQHGRWFFVIPIAIAFLFSLVHGSFTAHFWDLLGVKARPVKK